VAGPESDAKMPAPAAKATRRITALRPSSQFIPFEPIRNV
jgi:hypothetical protein